MFERRRPRGRLFYLVLAVAVMVLRLQAQGPATTTISDTVYRADGNPAGGVLLISWPAFTTSGGQTVAAGKTSATLGSGGALSVALVPNTGATPTETLYTVVYQLDDGTAKTEYWLVPATSPATVAQVRTPLGLNGSAGQLASQQFVNTAIAGKANDSAVVHLTGSETVTGVKAFTVAPTIPTPVLSTEVHYRGRGRALTRVTNPASIAAQTHGADDGIRSGVRHVKEPAARTASDCEHAALAILEGAATGWSGAYDTWSDFLPGGAADIFPGDELQVNAPSRAASFAAIVRQVEIDFWDLAEERSRYKIAFADDVASPLGFQFETPKCGIAWNPVGPGRGPQYANRRYLSGRSAGSRDHGGQFDHDRRGYGSNAAERRGV